jgi:hypothetical protein
MKNKKISRDSDTMLSYWQRCVENQQMIRRHLINISKDHINDTIRILVSTTIVSYGGSFLDFHLASTTASKPNPKPLLYSSVGILKPRNQQA